MFATVQLFSLVNKTYVIDESKLYRIDSVKLMSKAFGLPGKGSNTGFEFDDERGFNYIVSGESCTSITNKKLVRDSFKYSALVLTVYTNKEGINDYIKSLKSRTIEVFQLSIANTKYIDINNLNKCRKKTMTKSLLVFSLLFGFLFMLIKKDKFVGLIQAILKPPAPTPSSQNAASQSNP